VVSTARIAAILVAAVMPATTPARAAALAADPPASTSTAVSLDIPAIPGAGIAGLAGTWAVTHTESAGGLDRAFLPSSPSPVSPYVSVAVAVSTTTGTTPGLPAEWLAETSLTRISGPSLTAGGLKMVEESPEVRNTGKCNPPHGPLAASHITPNVVTAFGDK
jgi:hypothetical protein